MTETIPSEIIEAMADIVGSEKEAELIFSNLERRKNNPTPVEELLDEMRGLVAADRDDTLPYSIDFHDEMIKLIAMVEWKTLP